jgi:hypothetical protein
MIGGPLLSASRRPICGPIRGIFARRARDGEQPDVHIHGRDTGAETLRIALRPAMDHPLKEEQAEFLLRPRKIGFTMPYLYYV